MNAPGEIVLAWMERWTIFVKTRETKMVEKQKGTSVANMVKAAAALTRELRDRESNWKCPTKTRERP